MYYSEMYVTADDVCDSVKCTTADDVCDFSTTADDD